MFKGEKSHFCLPDSCIFISLGQTSPGVGTDCCCYELARKWHQLSCEVQARWPCLWWTLPPKTSVHTEGLSRKKKADSEGKFKSVHRVYRRSSLQNHRMYLWCFYKVEIHSLIYNDNLGGKNLLRSRSKPEEVTKESKKTPQNQKPSFRVMNDLKIWPFFESIY